MRSSLRNRLLVTFLILVIIVGAGTLFAIERTLADDLVSSLDARLTKQGTAVAGWLNVAGHPERLAPRLAAVTGARITIEQQIATAYYRALDRNAAGADGWEAVSSGYSAGESKKVSLGHGMPLSTAIGASQWSALMKRAVGIRAVYDHTPAGLG